MDLDPEMVEALRVLSERIGSRVSWVVVGSMSLALQGVDIKPKDIDILTDRKGAEEAMRVMKEYETEPLKYGETTFFRSYLGKLMVGGVRIEIMGELEEKFGERWTSLTHRALSPRHVEVSGLSIPVSSLQEQLESYRSLGRAKDPVRVKKIMDALKKRAKET